MTNGDKIFKAVIEDSALISYGGYNPDDYDSLQNALDDENVVISTVAKIIYYVTILFSALTRMFPKPTFAP